MLALVKAEAGPGLRLQDVPVPSIGINDVLIRVHKTGICGTDLHIDAWDPWAARTIQPPLVVGHEFVGDIVEVGANVSGFKPGDLVSGEGHVVCGKCRHCLAGQRHLCVDTVGLGVGRDGAFAEYVALPMTNIWHHAPGIDEDVAAIFDPFGNAVHTALSFDVPNTFRRELAIRMGATIAVDPLERDLHAVQAELGMVEGFDIALEMSGVEAALRSAIENMAHGGRIAILGIPTDEISLDVNTIVFNQLTLRGIYGREMYETWYQMTVMLQSGLDISAAITHRFGFRDFEAAFAAARSGDSGKVIMSWLA